MLHHGAMPSPLRWPLQTTTAQEAPASTSTKRRNTSISQIETAELCLRKWWLSRCAYVRRPRQQHFIVGDRMHAVAERFHQGERELFPAGWDAGLTDEQRHWLQVRTAEAIEAGVWQIRPGSWIEMPVCMIVSPDLLDEKRMPLIAEARIVYEQDRETGEEIRIIDRPTKLLDGSPLPPRWDVLPFLAAWIDIYDPGGNILPCVIDHKSAKNKRYAKKKEDIKQSVQMLTYSCYPFATTECERVEGRYNVILKDMKAKNGVFEVSDLITLKEASDRWLRNVTMVQMMEMYRDRVTAGEKKDPDRAKDFKRVPGAADYMNKKLIDRVCGAFGGCEYRDACHGMCSISQLTRRLDDQRANLTTQKTNQDQDLTRKPLISIPSNTITTDTLTGGSSIMPFGQPAPEAPTPVPGSDIYVRDPQTPQQYKARILTVDGGDKPFKVAIWPDPNTEPDWPSLVQNPMYQVELTTQDIQQSPAQDVPLARYDQALMGAGIAPEAVAWTPLQKQQPVSPFAGMPQAPSTPPPQATTQPPAMETSPPAPAWVPVVGQEVEVIPDTHSYWGQMAGRRGQVAEVVADGTCTVLIDGDPYPNVATGRFRPVQQAQQQSMTFTTSTGEQASQVQDPRAAQYQQYVGKDIHIQHASIDSSFRGTCESVTSDGIKLSGFESPVKWDVIGSVELMDDVPTPGDEKDAKRVADKHHLEGLTLTDAIEELEKLTATGEAKKQPGLGKRDLAKIRKYLDRIKELAAVPQSTPATPTAPAASGSYAEGFAAACQQIVTTVQGMQPGAVGPY